MQYIPNENQQGKFGEPQTLNAECRLAVYNVKHMLLGLVAHSINRSYWKKEWPKMT